MKHEHSPDCVCHGHVDRCEFRVRTERLGPVTIVNDGVTRWACWTEDYQRHWDQTDDYDEFCRLCTRHAVLEGSGGESTDAGLVAACRVEAPEYEWADPR